MSEAETKVETPAADPWKYIETKNGAHVFAGRFVVKAHWGGSVEVDDIRDLMKLIAVAPELLKERDQLRAALEAMVRWDDAEKTALPYGNDGGAAFRERIRLCEKAFTMARAALTPKPSTEAGESS